jgi:hypothetical protein
MAIAVITTLTLPAIQSYLLILLAVAIGGGIGVYIARKIEMTAMPQLVAAFHSLVGLAAVFIATAALLSPEAYNIGVSGELAAGSLLEMSLGSVIGAITFSGSIIAFADPLPVTAHAECSAWCCDSGSAGDFHGHRIRLRLCADDAAGLCAGRADHHPHRRCRHAGCGVHA